MRDVLEQESKRLQKQKTSPCQSTNPTWLKRHPQSPTNDYRISADVRIAAKRDSIKTHVWKAWHRIHLLTATVLTGYSELPTFNIAKYHQTRQHLQCKPRAHFHFSKSKPDAHRSTWPDPSECTKRRRGGRLSWRRSTSTSPSFSWRW